MAIVFVKIKKKERVMKSLPLSLALSTIQSTERRKIIRFGEIILLVTSLLRHQYRFTHQSTYIFSFRLHNIVISLEFQYTLLLHTSLVIFFSFFFLYLLTSKDRIDRNFSQKIENDFAAPVKKAASI